MDPDEREAVAAQFGASTEQVERDHLISHLLAYLSRTFSDRIHFIGGTALARSHLPDGRLSEDIDLIAVGTSSTHYPGHSPCPVAPGRWTSGATAAAVST